MKNMGWRMKIEAQTAEEIEAIQTPMGLRKLLNEYSRFDGLTRAVMQMAEREGLSDYEMLLRLAYHALVAKEKVESNFSDLLSLQPMPPFVAVGETNQKKAR